MPHRARAQSLLAFKTLRRAAARAPNALLCALCALFCLWLLAPVCAWAAPGDVDTTFGNGQAGADNTVFAVPAQSDGKVLIGGGFDRVNGTRSLRIARLNFDGSLDQQINAFLTLMSWENNLTFQSPKKSQIFR